MSLRRSRSHLKVLSPSITPSPTPTLPPTLVQREVVTVLTTITSSQTATVSPKVHVPVGAVVGGTIAGVLVVVLAGLFWWWWVANKPRELTPQEREARTKQRRKTIPGVVPVAASSARPGHPSHSKSSLSSGKGVPLIKLKPSSTRSVSGTPLLLNTSSPSLPIVNKHAPAKPSPLSLGRAVTPDVPKWGQVPFVAQPPALVSSTSLQQHQVNDDPSSLPYHSSDPFASGFSAPSHPVNSYGYPLEQSQYLSAEGADQNEEKRVSQQSAMSAASNYSNGEKAGQGDYEGYTPSAQPAYHAQG